MNYLTDQIYRASKDPRINALQDLKTPQGLPDIGARLAAAMALHNLGLVLDEGIDIYGNSPFFQMRWFASLELKWHEALFQSVPASVDDYKDASKAWPGSITVSIDAADYPPFLPPTPPIEPSQSPVGGPTGTPGVFAVNPSVFFKNGAPQYTEGSHAVAPDGETVYAHWGSSGIITNLWWWETAQAKATRMAAGG